VAEAVAKFEKEELYKTKAMKALQLGLLSKLAKKLKKDKG
jgi:hypothetical protein